MHGWLFKGLKTYLKLKIDLKEKRILNILKPFNNCENYRVFDKLATGKIY